MHLESSGSENALVAGELAVIMHRMWVRAVRLDGRSLVSHPGAAAMQTPNRSAIQECGFAGLRQTKREFAGCDDPPTGQAEARGLSVAILAAVLTDGLPAVEAACAQAMSEGVHSS